MSPKFYHWQGKEGVMVRYEVLTCKKGRWTADGILGTRNAAVEHAQALAHRDYLIAAVRVNALEDNAEGFREKTIYNRRVSRVPTADTPSALGMRSQRISNRKAGLQSPSDRRARILVLLLVIACSAVIGYGLLRPQQPWVFDTPDAQKPHLLRDPFTGQFS
jgi:hypothetical protein